MTAVADQVLTPVSPSPAVLESLVALVRSLPVGSRVRDLEGVVWVRRVPSGAYRCPWAEDRSGEVRARSDGWVARVLAEGGEILRTE